MFQLPANARADDESCWSAVRAQYAPSPEFINLENGYFGMPAKPVRDALQRYQQQVDAETGYFLRMRFPERLARVKAALADFAGVSADELLITRSAVESLNILIQGYPFAPGDQVLLARHDYDSAIDVLGMLAARKSIDLAWTEVPLDPEDDEQVVACYEAALKPRTRLLLLTHMIHRTGQILPVAKIAAMARRRGIDVIVDGAHSLAQLDYQVPALGTQFAAFNLHKWFGAPLGLGLLYIARDRIADIAPLYGDVGHAPERIDKLGHVGVVPPAPILAIEDALAFHRAIGARNKEARLRYLSRYWQERVRALPGVRLFTPRDPRRYCAIACFGIEGMAAQEVVERLLADHRIFTVVRRVGDLDVVRVTPHLYTSIDQLDTLVGAVRALARSGCRTGA